MSGSLHVGLAALGAAIGVGLIGMAASTAVGRNPGASTKIAFAEAIVLHPVPCEVEEKKAGRKAEAAQRPNSASVQP